MAHTNLFLYETEEDFLAAYPEGKMDQPVPGVAYIRGEEGQLGTLHTNREVTTYEITIHSTDKSGVTVAQDRVIQTNPVLDGNSVKMNVVAEPVEGYKPRHEVEKVTFTSASTEHTIIYLAPTSYTVTVNYMYSGETIAPSSAIVIEDIFEEDIVRLRIEPLSIPGYSASPVTISVSGDMEYDLEYERGGCTYEYVDLGLPSGNLWATCNVGACSPEEFGDYFAWAETSPKSNYDWDTYRYAEEEEESESRGGSYVMTKYNYDDGLTVLEAGDDAASVNMGVDWCMPSLSDFDELMMYVIPSWTTLNGVTGLLLTSTSSTASGNTIFFPAAGLMEGNNLNWVNVEVDIWTREIADNSENAYGVCFTEDGNGPSPSIRTLGLSVRGIKPGDNPFVPPFDPGPSPK